MTDEVRPADAQKHQTPNQWTTPTFFHVNDSEHVQNLTDMNGKKGVRGVQNWVALIPPPAFDFVPCDATRGITKSMIFLPINQWNSVFKD